MTAHVVYTGGDIVTIDDARPAADIAGPALVEVGLAVVGSLNVREQARPMMEELAAESGETVHLGVLEGDQVRYVDAVESERALRVVARTGTLVPAHCTSLGKALLAQLADQQVAALYPTSAEPFAARTERSITTQAKLMKEVSRVKARGYTVNAGETEDDVGSVAVAFRDFAGGPPPLRWPHRRRLTTPRISQIARALESPAIAQTPAD